MKNEYRIPEENIEGLTKKITSINNKAKKLGCGEINFQVTGEDYVTLNDGEVISEETIIINKLAGINTEFYKRIIVEIEGTAPHLNGWEFMATLEHLDNGNIIRKATNEEIPVEYRTAVVKCDHCGIKRARKDTYLIRNTETGEYKQVGSGCLLDFFNGQDPHNTAKYAELLTKIEGEVGIFFGMTQPASYIETKQFLNYVEECINRNGWVGRSTAEFRQKPTADEAYDMMFGKYGPRNPNNTTRVEDALNWLTSQPASNDYMYNLKAACSNEYIHHRLIGIVAALMITYKKHLEKQKPVLDTSNSNFIGNINDKIELVVTVKRSAFYESIWGAGYINTFVDDNGNALVWKTGSNFEEGKKYKIKGTIKGHDTYKDEKQTQLTRCKAIEIS
jgi:hypothetical protein